MRHCIHLLPETGELVRCPNCKNNTGLKVFGCKVFGECTLVTAIDGMACCNGYRDENARVVACPLLAYSVEEAMAIKPSPSRLKWAYGLTTVPDRKDDLLPKTLASLAKAGFDRPRLFIDGAKPDASWDKFPYELTFRYPTIRTQGNWVLAAIELFCREPNADRYAIFQDDFVTVPNLRAYLEATPYPEKGYLNLYTFPSNQELAPAGKTGWYLSNQFGRGALALVFDSLSFRALLSSKHMIERPLDAHRGWKAIDGGIVTALAKEGIKEYVHNPSLTQHLGELSVMRNRPHPKATSFPGEDFDALSLLGENRVRG